MRATRIGAWTMLGVSGAAAIASGTMLGLAFSENAKQEAAADDEDWDARDRHWANTKNYSVASAITGGVAATAATASIFLFIVSRDKGKRAADSSQPGVTVAPIVSPKLPGVMVRVRF